MAVGPLDVVVIQFEGNRFEGQILPALREIVDKGIVRILDLAFVKKDRDGAVTTFEIGDIDSEGGRALEAQTGDVGGLLSEDDLRQAAVALENNSSAALLVFEHTWAARLQQAILDANGRLLTQVRIPRDVVEQSMKARAAGTGSG